jgi:hypothetical protein
MKKNNTPEVCPSLASRPDRLLATGTDWDANIAIARSEAARQYIILRNRRIFRDAGIEDLRLHANAAMVAAVRRGCSGATLRLDIRHSLRDLCRRNQRISHYASPMPNGDIFNRDWNKNRTDPRICLITQTIHELSERQQQAIRLVYFDGLTEQEAAVAMGCTHQGVHKHLCSGIARLQKIFSASGCKKNTSFRNYRTEGQNERDETRRTRH